MIVTACLIFIAVRQQPVVSCELRGIRLENAAPMLARTLGLDSLTIDPVLKNDVLLVRTTGVNPELLKSKVAKVLNATWTHRDDGWYLGQTAEQRAKDLATNEAQRLKKFTKLVEGIHGRSANLPEFNETTCKKIQQEIVALSKVERTETSAELLDKRVSKVDSNDPSERFAKRLAQRLTPQMFMRLSLNRPAIVYCNHPTSMQLAMPFAVDDLVSEMVREQNLWVRIAGKEPVTTKKRKSSDEEDESYDYLGQLNSNREELTKDKISTITVRVDNRSDNVTIRAYDKDGQLTLSDYASSSIGSLDIDEPLNGTVGFVSRGIVRVEETQDDPSKLIGEDEQYLSFLFNFDPKMTGETPKASFIQKLVQPEKHDPLSFIIPTVTLAKIKSKNLVILLADEESPGEGMAFGLLTDQQEPRSIVEEDGDWYLSTFRDPVKIREESLDRKVMGPILRFLEQNRRELSLEEESKLAFDEQWHVKPSWTYDSLKRKLGSNASDSFYESGDIESGRTIEAPMRIYGSMTELERRRCFSGEVAVGFLSQSTRQEIFRGVFYSGNQRGLGRGSRSGISTNFPDEENLTPEQQKLEDLVNQGAYSDPTFALPKGIQDEYRFSLTQEFKPMLSILYRNQDRSSDSEKVDEYTSTGITDAEGLGRALFDQTKPPEKYIDDNGVETISRDTSKIDESKIGILTQRDIKVTLRISQWMSISWPLTGMLTTDTRTYTLKSLPSQFQADIRHGYEEAEKEYKEEMQNKTETPVKKFVPPPMFL